MLGNTENTQSNSLILQRVLRALLSNWYLLVALPLFGFGIGLFYSYRLQDVYAAKGRVILKASDVVDYQQQLYAGLGVNSAYGSYDQVESQKRVIRSSNLISEVLDRLDLDVSYFIEGRIKTTEVYKSTPFRVEPIGNANRAGGNIKLQIQDTNTVQLSFFKGEEEVLRVLDFEEEFIADGFAFVIHRTFNITKSHLTSLKEINYFFKFNDREVTINRIKSGLTIESLEYTSVLEFTLTDHIVERAVDVLDTLSEVYKKYTLINKQEVNENTQTFISLQIKDVQGKIDDIEGNRESYKDSVSILDIEREEIQSFEQLAKLEIDVKSLELNLRSINDLELYISKDNYTAQSFLPPSTVHLKDPFVLMSVNSIYELQIEKKNLLNSATNSNNIVVIKDSEIIQVRSDLLTYLRNIKSSAEDKLKLLNAELVEKRNNLRNLPKNQRELLNIERQLKVNEELMNFLLQRKAETIIAQAGIVSQTRVIENPRSVGVVAPNKKRLKMIPTLIGLALALAIGSIRSFLFFKLVSVPELSSVTKIPIIGGVRGGQPSKEYLKITDAPKSALAESFRTIRTNLDFFLSNSDGEFGKTILVSSLYPGEGKTFTSANIAGILAAAGKKTIIVDFDLHKPRVNKAFSLSKKTGVSTIITGNTLLNDTIVKNQENEHLSILTSGPIPPNPSELIMSNEVQVLLDELKKQYEFIILDTPPVLMISDAVVLAKQA
ncbi:MAG: capsular exopolysaccharide synthesis family protein, partial [Salibacteraceae bacterium]